MAPHNQPRMGRQKKAQIGPEKAQRMVHTHSVKHGTCLTQDPKSQ